MNPEVDSVAALPSHYCRDSDCKLHHHHKMAALKFQVVGALFLYDEQKRLSIGYLNLHSSPHTSQKAEFHQQYSNF